MNTTTRKYTNQTYVKAWQGDTLQNKLKWYVKDVLNIHKGTSKENDIIPYITIYIQLYL